MTERARSLAAPLTLVLARARRRPARGALTVIGIALAIGFAGSVIAEATIAADRSARTTLATLGPLDRSVRVSWQGVVTPSVRTRALAILRQVGLPPPTEVVLLNPVRLSGVVVRPVAISPLSRWTGGAAAPVSACRAQDCPMLLADGEVGTRVLAAPGVRIPVVGSGRLTSPVPLAFVPSTAGQQPPIVISGDPSGLEALPALGAVYRTHSWVSELSTAALHSWQLAALQSRLQRVQSALLASGSQFSLAAPFAGIGAASAQADAAPRRLLLAGGGALATLILFIVLSGGALRRDQAQELERLRAAGARGGQGAAFVIGEAALLCGAGAILGAAIGVVVAALLAGGAGLPAGGVLTHSIVGPAGLLVLAGGWLLATALVAASLLQRGGRIADVAAIAGAAALILALVLDRGGSGTDPLPVLLAPLCCLAAGVVVFRAGSRLLETGERLGRRGPLAVRLALVGLARSPGPASLAIAFIAVSTGLGGFALAYRATLIRGTSDQAADQVPLDAIVTPGPDFTRPLQVASLGQWHAATGGAVEPVRRTDASFVSGGSSVTVPALGVPATALTLLHGWRASDATTSLAVLSDRLRLQGSARTPGPAIPAAARFLSLQAASPSVAVSITAELRNGAGEIQPLMLGTAGERPSMLGASLPPGRWELEALAFAEPTGLEITNGHQNGENAAPATQVTTTVRLWSVRALARRGGRPLRSVSLGTWRAVGAAGGASTRGLQTTIRFATSGTTGILRPQQPTDTQLLPVLVDPQTASAAGRGHVLPLSIDGEPIDARIVGVLRRFPTLPAGTSGFVVADEQALAGALDARAPGQGRPDELWLTLPDPRRLPAVSRNAPFARLDYALRADVERRLRSAPIARGVLGTLLAAAAVAGLLSVLGLLVALLGGLRDQRVEHDLIAQGLGPAALRRELRVRMALAAALGVLLGLGIAALLTRLAVASVQGAGAVSVPRPPLVTVAPWRGLALWAIVALAALVAAAWIATVAAVGRRATG